jgi:hypothetical protein
MASDLFIEDGEEKNFFGKVVRVNNDGTVDIETDLEKLTRLFEMRPDLKEKFLQTYMEPKE